MPQSEVIHLVPNFPPALDGIGDYAARLCLELREECGISSGIVVGDPAWKGDVRYKGIPVKAVERRSSHGLARAVGNAATIAVHYVGYGYQRRGVPLWLDAGLARWHQGDPTAREIVFFHELWASGPVWGSAFWLGPMQRWLTKRRLMASHVALTSTPWMSRLLEIESGKEVFWRPIPAAFAPLRSSPKTVPNPEQAASGLRVLVFGLEGPRLRALRLHEDFLAALFAEGRLAALTLAGKGSEYAGFTEKQKLGSIPVTKIRFRGSVAENEIAKLFAGHDLLLTAHPACLMCKSTVIMNALAAGCVPILADSADSHPLTEGVEFLAYQPNNTGINALLNRLDKHFLCKLSENCIAWAERNATWEQTVMLFKEALTERSLQV